MVADFKKAPRKSDVVFWTVFIVAVVVVVLGIVLPWLLQMYAPLLFPKANVSGLVQWVQNAATIVSFASVVLGAYSIYQASAGSKAMNLALNKINQIKEGQDQLTSAFFHNPNVSHSVATLVVDAPWKQDGTKD